LEETQARVYRRILDLIEEDLKKSDPDWVWTDTLEQIVREIEPENPLDAAR
jgi:hypothetical protein